MKRFASVAASLALFAATAGAAQHMEIAPNGSRPSGKGAAQNFTGSVILDPLFPATAERRFSGGQVIFEPGARSAWHSHPAGQVLIVTSGVGWAQEWGGEKREVKPGDVIWTPPGVKHWHGATATTSMRHVAIQENVDGWNVDWMEQVRDDDYLK